MTMKDFAGKVFAITGAASGIGRALSVALAKQGARLALADKDEAGLGETARLIGNAHHFTRVLDVADKQAMADFAAAAVAAFGQVDAVVNNAGVTVVAPAEATERADFAWLMEINFWGVVNGTEAFLPYVRKRPDGAVVNISSVFGLIGFPGQSAYNAAKFAVRGYTEALRHEMALTDPGLLVACVHPGGIATPIARNARFRRAIDGGDHATTIAAFEANTRTTPEGAAAAILTGIKNRRPRILIGPDARLVDWVQRVAPVRYFSLLSRLTRRR